MKFLIKLLLIAGLAVFALWNYRVLSFDKGISKTDNYLKGDSAQVDQFLENIFDVNKIEYYDTPFKENNPQSPDSQIVYKVYVVTSADAYLLDATQNDIDDINLLSKINDKYKPNKITPIPFYVEIILAFIILVIPFGRRKRRRRDRDYYDD